MARVGTQGSYWTYREENERTGDLCLLKVDYIDGVWDYSTRVFNDYMNNNPSHFGGFITEASNTLAWTYVNSNR